MKMVYKKIKNNFVGSEKKVSKFGECALKSIKLVLESVK